MIRRLLGWSVVVSLLGLAGAGAKPEAAHGTPLLRTLGPVAALAADVQWIRFRYALTAGDHERAIALAETAIALDPTDTRGWDLLASHLGLYLGSTNRAESPTQRLSWLQAGLATARAGEAVAEDPAALALVRGVMLQTHAELDPDLPWPGGHRALWTAAAQAYAEAAAGGIDEAKDAMRYAEERVRE